MGREKIKCHQCGEMAHILMGRICPKCALENDDLWVKYKALNKYKEELMEEFLKCREQNAKLVEALEKINSMIANKEFDSALQEYYSILKKVEVDNGL